MCRTSMHNIHCFPGTREATARTGVRNRQSRPWPARGKLKWGIACATVVLHLCAMQVADADSTWQQTATGPAYGGDTSPTGDDVWVSCNPTTGYDSLGGSCVRNRHTPIYTHDPNARDTEFHAAANSHLGSIVVPEGGGIGTKESPARSCADLARLPHFVSGYYWLKPSQDVEAFEGFCDQDSFGGGWLMCYTTAGEVHIASEVSSVVDFGLDGYRSDCRNYPFNQVLYMEHDLRTGATSDDKAWFAFRGRNALVAAKSEYKGAVDFRWAAGLDATGILFEPKGFASARTPQCVQERRNSACKHDVVASFKLQDCPDCYAVRPQKGNATCPGNDASQCWCDAHDTTGCAANVAQRALTLAASNEADVNFYAGWHITITSGTGTGQIRKISSSTGGSCSSSSYRTRAACVGAHATWSSGTNRIETESVWAVLPCSNSKLDGFRCQAACSATYPLDGSTCNNEVVYGTQASCEASCLAFDPNPSIRGYTINYEGLYKPDSAPHAATTLASAVASTTTVEVLVTDASTAIIVAGKRIRVDNEIMLVRQVRGFWRWGLGFGLWALSSGY
jgi:hypothetical protein